MVWWFGIRDAQPPTLQRTAAAFKGYTSVTGLAEDADVIVVGTVEGIVGRGWDEGSEGNPAPGIIPDEHTKTPMAFYQVAVSEVLQGDPGATIIVARIDHTIRWDNNEKPLETGQEVLLFLDSIDNPDVFTIFKDRKDLYVPLSLDNGVFEVSDNKAVPRMNSFFRTPGDVEVKSFALDEVREKLGDTKKAE